MSAELNNAQHILNKPKEFNFLGTKKISDRIFIKLFSTGMVAGMALSALTGTYIGMKIRGDVPENSFQLKQQVLNDVGVQEISPYLKGNELLSAGILPASSGIGYSIELAAKKWFDAGMSIDSIEEALYLANQFSPLTYGVNSANLKQDFILNEIDLADYMNSKFAPVKYNLEHNIQVSRSEADYKMLEKEIQIFRASWNPEVTNSSVLNVKTGATYEQAAIAMEDAVSKAGLAYLRLPLAYYSDPNVLVAAAERIELANTQLQTIMKLDGPVLGLNGLVGLNIERPISVDEHEKTVFLNGTTELKNTDRSVDLKTLTRIPKDPIDAVITINTTWQALGHEFNHAKMVALAKMNKSFFSMDITEDVARYEKMNFMEKIISFNKKPNNFSYAANQIIEQYGFIDSESKTAQYLNAPSERMAYATAGYYAIKGANALYEVPPFQENGSNYPTQSEIASLETNMDFFFEQTRNLMVENGYSPRGQNLEPLYVQENPTSSFRTLDERKQVMAEQAAPSIKMKNSF